MRQAGEIRREADEYAYRVLQKLREQIASVAATVERGISELEARGAHEEVANSI